MVTVRLENTEKRVPIGTRLSDCLSTDLPCGGHGRCGKCKVVASGSLSPLSAVEKKTVSAEEIAAGVRLACQTTVLGDCTVRHLPGAKATVLTAGLSSQYAVENAAFSSLGLAVDLGTTTVAAKLIDRTGKVLAEAGAVNPQTRFGADVISRIEASLAGHGRELAEDATEAIASLIADLCATADRHASEIDGAVVTGNTAMLYLLTNTSPEPLSQAPFAMTRRFGETVTAASLGLSVLPAQTVVYLPACLSAFVGGDTVCALLATRLCETNETALLADIGTNGEMALWRNGTLTVCSAAAGPALEGVGLSCGMRAAYGAIDRVQCQGNRLITHTVGEGPARGLCGSGLLDAIACLLLTGRLEPDGYLEESAVALAPSVTLTQGDIRAAQLAKSAICSGLQTLMHTTGTAEDGIETFFLAGGFATAMPVKNAVRIGLIPAGLAPKCRAVGNAALEGAVQLLTDRERRKQAMWLAENGKTVALAEDPFFAEAFVQNMRFG